MVVLELLKFDMLLQPKDLAYYFYLLPYTDFSQDLDSLELLFYYSVVFGTWSTPSYSSSSHPLADYFQV